VTSTTPPVEWGRPYGEIEDVFSPVVDSLEPSLLESLRATGAGVDTGEAARAEASRDWWPLALRWESKGRAPARPAAVVRPESTEQVSAVLRLAGEARVPVTAAAGRSGVCGGAIPLFGGIALDCRGLAGLLEVDDVSLHVSARAGTFGPDLESELRARHGLTVGHWPQSFELSTVGGWLACRGAGQYSTRYGKIEDLVAGLEVVLSSGRVVRTGSLAGAGPRAAAGPDLTQLFVGSEGTLGVITEVALRARPVASYEQRGCFAFPSFEAGLEALRATLRTGATPAVLRLYDATESARNFGQDDVAVLIAIDEGHSALVKPAIDLLSASCRDEGAEVLGPELAAHWLATSRDVSALGPLTRAGIVLDTIEVSAPWSDLAGLYRDAIGGLRALESCLAASAHESHAYLDGACLYFTFAGRGPDPDDEVFAVHFYEQAYEVVMSATRRHRGSISHHHGIGFVRGPYLAEALGEGFHVLEVLKAALDPAGILNPGKLGLASAFGRTPLLGEAAVT
jgi:alkyldihydroxyacetonephosphate synthase